MDNLTELVDPIKLEARRREIILTMTTVYKGYDDPQVPMEMLRELAFITSTLRRKQAGPPRAKARTSAKPTLEDL